MLNNNLYSDSDHNQNYELKQQNSDVKSHYTLPYRIIPNNLLNSEELSSAEKAILFFSWMIQINGKVRLIHLDKRWRVGRKNANASKSFSRQLINHLKSMKDKDFIDLIYSGNKLTHIKLNLSKFDDSKCFSVPHVLAIDFETSLKEMFLVALQIMNGEMNVNHLKTLGKYSSYCNQTVNKYLSNSSMVEKSEVKMYGKVIPNYRLKKTFTEMPKLYKKHRNYREKIEQSVYQQPSVDELVNFSRIFKINNKIIYYYKRDINKRLKRHYVSNLNHVWVEHEKVKGLKSLKYFEKFLDNIDVVCIDGRLFVDGIRKDYHPKLYLSVNISDIFERKKEWITDLLRKDIFKKLIFKIGPAKFLKALRGRLRAIHEAQGYDFAFNNLGSFEAFAYKLMKKYADSLSQRTLIEDKKAAKRAAENEKAKQKIAKEIEQIKESPVIKKIRKDLFDQLVFAYSYLIHKAELSIDGNDFVIKFVTKIQMEYASENYQDIIHSTIQRHFKNNHLNIVHDYAITKAVA